MRRDRCPGWLERSVQATAVVTGLAVVLAAGGAPGRGSRGGSVVGPDVIVRESRGWLQGLDGKQLFAKHCTSCHGVEGRGDGVAGRAMKPPPPDIANPVFLATVTDDSIATVVRDGVRGMKPLGKVLTRAQIQVIVGHLRALGQARGE